MAESVEQLQPQKSKRKKKWNPEFHRVSAVDKIFFTQHLEVMTRTGFPLADALDTIARSIENEYLERVILDIREGIERGEPLSQGLKKYPRIFPEIYTSMIEAGEVSGKLDEVLKQLTIQQRKRHELIAQAKSSLSYPAVVLTAMLVIGTGIVIFVLPKITQIYEDVHAELPLPTRIVIWFSKTMTQYGIWVGVGIILLCVLFVMWYRTEKGKRLVHKLLLRLPIVKTILMKMSLAAFARNLSSLLKTDIPIMETFRIISRTMGSVPYREALSHASEDLEKGIPIHAILEREPFLFPPLVSQIVSIGEQTGTLDTVTAELASFYEEDVAHLMEGLSTLIEPVLMLVLGAAVGGLAVAVILPIYSLVNQI